MGLFELFSRPDDLDLLHAKVGLLEAENKKLKIAIRRHRDQKGDDRCWLDDQELYKVLGEGPANTALPPKEIFLKNCERYFECRQVPGAVYVTLADGIKYKEILEDAYRYLIYSNWKYSEENGFMDWMDKRVSLAVMIEKRLGYRPEDKK